MNSSRGFEFAIGLSLLIHLALVFVIPGTRASMISVPVEITLVKIPPSLKPPEKKQPVQQLVSPSAERSAVPPEETRFKSEHDSKVEKESLRRGEEGGAPVPNNQISKSQNQKKMPERKAVEGKLARTQPDPPREAPNKPAPKMAPVFKLSDESLREHVFQKQDVTQLSKRDSNIPQHQSASASTERERSRALEQREPFGPSGFAALFKGKPGSADYLPDIPDGDITLLNAKADRFAVFVRRVAHQVFGLLRQKSWQELSSLEISSLGGFVDLQATMSPGGKLLAVKILESSGSGKFDEMVSSAVKAGTWDQNPPKTAVADDGNIHFIFKAKTWTRGGREGFSEQRWLLLGTGLL